MSDELVGFTRSLHEKIHVQARNLLLEYRLAHENRGWVPVDVVYRLMQLYGELIALEIFNSMKKDLDKLYLNGSSYKDKEEKGEPVGILNKKGNKND